MKKREKARNAEVQRQRRASLGGLSIAVLAALALLLPLAATAMEDEDIRQKANDLSQVCALSEKEILDIYHLRGDFEYVTHCFLVYDALYKIGGETGVSRERLLRLSKDTDVVVLWEAAARLQSEGLRGKDMETRLVELSEGKPFADIAAEIEKDSSPEPENYRALSEEEIRALLKTGGSAQDVLYADELARAEDITVADAIEGKPADKSWERHLADRVEGWTERDVQTKIKVVTSEGIKTYSAESPQALTRQVEEEYTRKRRSELDKLSSQGVDVEAYLREGYLPEEIETAVRLAKERGRAVETIFAEKEAGRAWADIAATKEAAP